MKKIFLSTIILFLFFFSSEAKEVALNTTAYKVDTLPISELKFFLEQMNVKSYYGKSVDSFLAAVPAISYNMKVYGGSHSQGAHFRASYLWYTYSGGFVIRIYVREYTHLKRYSRNATWDVNLFRKEKVYKIEVYGDHTCINGSCLK